MHSLQSKTGPVSIGEAFIKDRSAGLDVENNSRVLIRQANTVDITAVFQNYGIKLDQYNKKCICPFKFHSNDKTASFTLYFDTNSFYCFGCNKGGGPVNFIHYMDGSSLEEAARKIIEKFNLQIGDEEAIAKKGINEKEKRETILDFSNSVRDFIFSNLDDENALLHAEKVSQMYDGFTSKHKDKIDNSGLKKIVDMLKTRLEGYKFK